MPTPTAKTPITITISKRNRRKRQTTVAGFLSHGITKKTFMKKIASALAAGSGKGDHGNIVVMGDHEDGIKAILTQEYNISANDIKIVRSKDCPKREPLIPPVVPTQPTEDWAVKLLPLINTFNDAPVQISDYTEELNDYCKKKRELVMLEWEYERDKLESIVIESAIINWRAQEKTWVGDIEVPYTLLSNFCIGNHLALGTDIQIRVVVLSIDEKNSEVRVLYEPLRDWDLDDDSDEDEEEEEEKKKQKYSNTSTPPDVADVHFIFNPITYQRQISALALLERDFLCKNRPYMRLLKAHFLGTENDGPCNSKLPLPMEIPGHEKPLNDSQRGAISRCFTRPLTMIQGPPGTGKTTTIAAFCYYHMALYPGARNLVCGPSNTSADQLAIAIHRIPGINVVRYTTENAPVNPEISDINVYNMCLEQDERLAWLAEGRTNGTLSPEEKEEYKVRLEAACREILEKADVICCTTCMAGSRLLRQISFRCVIIDEVPQARDSECVVPFVRASEKVILVGDHKQLGPSIKCQKVKDMGGEISVFERLEALGKQITLLDIQYRMHPEILYIPNNLVYHGRLKNGVAAEERTNPTPDFCWPVEGIPMVFVDVNGTEEKGELSESTMNYDEVWRVCKILETLMQNGVSPDRIGIITPYQAQRRAIQSECFRIGETDDSYLDIEISTIDGFQGREKDYIIFSCVRNNTQCNIGFLADKRRMNVALTRAKYGLIIVGSAQCIKPHLFWDSLIEYFDKKGLIMK